MKADIERKVDDAFKRLIGVEENGALLSDLLNAVLDCPDELRVVWSWGGGPVCAAKRPCGSLPNGRSAGPRC